MSDAFLGGNLALDFVGTISERNRSRVEHLQTGPDLAAWVSRAGVVDDQPAVDLEDLAGGIRLREALYALVRSLIDADTLPGRDALAVINAAAGVPPPRMWLGPDGFVHRTGDLAAALSTVARDGIRLVDQPDAQLKWCADADCTHPFLDRSRGRRRRWCGMAWCGDRAKAAAYRARRRKPQHLDARPPEPTADRP